MIKLTLIAAIGKNNELGINNDLIWKIKEDLNFFQTQTINKLIIMGKNTYLSLPNLLKNRIHLVLSHNKIENDEVYTFKTIEEFLNFADYYDQEIMVIGGGKIYELLLPYANKIILTEINAEEKKATVFFPKFNKDDYIEEELLNQQETTPTYRRVLYLKK